MMTAATFPLAVAGKSTNAHTAAPNNPIAVTIRRPTLSDHAPERKIVAISATDATAMASSASVRGRWRTRVT